MRLPTPEKKVSSVLPFREEPEGQEDPSSSLPTNSSPFQASLNPYQQTPIPCNDPTSECIKIDGCSGSPEKTSNPAAASNTGRVVSNFIRYSAVPLSTLGPPAFSSSSCSGISYSTSYITRSTPKDHSDLEDVGRIGIIAQNINQDSVYLSSISPIETTSPMTNSSCSISLLSSTPTDSSTIVNVGSKESIQRDINSSSRENSLNSPDLIYSVPQNTPLENENINTSPSEYRPNSSDSMYSVPLNAPLENENTFETSRLAVERQCSSWSPTETSSSENRQISPYSVYLVPPNTPLENGNINSSPSESGQNSPDSVYFVPPNTPLEINKESLISSKENSDSDNGTRNIKSLVNLDSGGFPSKEDSTYPKSSLEENGQNITPLKNENSSKTSTIRLCSSQLQADASPSNTSKGAIRKSKHIKNSTGYTNRFALYPYDQNKSTKSKSFNNRNSGCHRFKENSKYPKSASGENGQSSTSFESENSSKISKYRVKRRCSSQLQADASPSNTSKGALRKSKHIKNSTGYTNRFALYPDDQNQSTKNKSFKKSNSGCHRFRGNSTFPKSASEENGQNGTRLKNENSSKISKLPVKRHCSSQLQTNASLSNTSKCPVRESKYTENATGCTNRLASNPNDQNQSTKNKSLKNRKSGCHRFKWNSTYPKSASEENNQTNNPLKNGNSSKTSIYVAKRHCSSQLQTNVSPSNTPKCPVQGSKHTENATGCTNRIVLYPDHLYSRPIVRPSDNSKAANALLEDKGRKNSMMSRYPETHASESFATSNPKKSRPSSNERNIIENLVESLRQSYISLSMRSDLPTDASEMSITSNKPDSKRSANSRTKTRKKSKLVAFFTTCFRSSSPRRERQI